MNCYKFKVGDTEISIPTEGKPLSWDNIIASLLETDQKIIQQIIDAVENYNYNKKKDLPKITDLDKREALNIIAGHLRDIGITVHFVSDMRAEGFPNNTDAAVKNGEIYLTYNSSVSSPMHEFLHLVFSVMKYDNHKKFIDLMTTISQIQEVQQIRQELGTEYEGMLDSDIQEEAFVRYMSGILEGKYEISNEFDQIYDEINNVLSPFIQKTFGLDEIVDLIDFLKSPFSDLIKQGSNLFIQKNLETTGYSDQKYKVELVGKIMNYIQYLVNQGNIQEGDCI